MLGYLEKAWRDVPGKWDELDKKYTDVPACWESPVNNQYLTTLSLGEQDSQDLGFSLVMITKDDRAWNRVRPQRDSLNSLLTVVA